MGNQDRILTDAPVEHVLTTDDAVQPSDHVKPSQPVAPPSPLRWAIRRTAFVAALLLVGFVVYSGVAGLVQANSLDDRIVETQAEILQLRRDADQLAALIAWLDSDAYIERIAREDLGMVRPGEEAFAVHAPGRGQLEVNRSPWWANLLPPGVD